jgi:Phage tail assembly chaperone protein, TAC
LIVSNEVTIGERTYIIGKLSAIDQFHVFRRVMPLLSPILESLKSGVGIGPLTMVAISNDLAKLSDEQLNYVIDKCLAVVQVQTDNKLIRLMINGRSMFGDLDLPTMMQIMWAVLMENFQPFLAGILDRPSSVEVPIPATSSN